MCRINPRVDFAFKKLFGSEENKDLLISLINAIVSDEDRVAEVELKNPYNLADYQAGKISILDIKAKSEQGRWFNVEMQISEDYNFDKRAIYYWAKLVTEQLSEGMMFRELKKTISINILDFNFIPDTLEFHNCYKIINTATGKDDKLHDVFELHYIELRKFIKPYREITTALDRWSTFLTKAHQLDKQDVPEQLRGDPAIVKAITAVDRMFDEDERLIYETRMQALADVESKIASAEEKGLEKGREEGMEKGLEKGKEEAAHAIARNLLKQGLDHETIAQATGLSVGVIAALAEAGESAGFP
ncbi:Rpn family recombination-promoting nuclease/putative transposase [Methylicorpusculum sp.]|uniref:Rpn family recombination-promoting nuclease/putative transposase n=1 Tax=Methylicorpusculum sp. TaxID=2713644 RepID=UPI00272F70A9|nr:Rpn family recombination-promoting nuclease/putative transposase [Methylicorpusculum sp.]MDP2179640.1 Rpn family recombination-promoting nuclease/putative transposase [Methylicorpusculum sp.]MDP3528915.1 Rpn family recombination-promoting nuclease/putative transposase [Methylicorpusculum sp.]MDZ4153842.1 Rpn family recombination-promoting nuclease/putative transposase [Methylicorpusculum sp.]